MDGDTAALYLFAGLAALAVAYMFFLGRREARRRRALRKLATRHGLTYHKSPDFTIPGAYSFLSRIARGFDRHAFNILRGEYAGQTVLAFDYHYVTLVGFRGKHHFVSVFLLEQSAAFPEVEIIPRSLEQRISEALGMTSIAFESVQFNEAFVVRSVDRRFAYDVCHPQMMELLLKRPAASIEIEDGCIAICYDERVQASDIELSLDALVSIRSMMPAHLYER